jgi:pyruvate/2-oxoglutarate dehydrogenase complex dihydrolipoamide acyltransferase (E2) component
MSTIDVRMPADQNEGTEASVGRWLKNKGELVHENEPLVEISTDKVTLGIAAPATGMLLELLKVEGETVFAGELLGRIGGAEAEDSKDPGEVVSPSADKMARPSTSGAQGDSEVWILSRRVYEGYCVNIIWIRRKFRSGGVIDV